MRFGIGIAAGTVGFVLYGALYFAAFSYLFPDPELAIRMTVIGMLLSESAFLVGFRVLDGDGATLFAKALALPLIGVAALLLVTAFLKFSSGNIIDIALLGLGWGLWKLYDIVNWIFFPAR